MADDVIPDDVRLFILQHIDSIAQLEGLLMLRASPHKPWSADELAGGLYISTAQATALLGRLLEQEFLTATPSDAGLRYQFNPKSTALRDMTERIADVYGRYLVPVTNLIHAKSKTRIQEFADAFRIRKD